MDFCVYISSFLVVDNAVTLFNYFFRDFRDFRGFDQAENLHMCFCLTLAAILTKFLFLKGRLGTHMSLANFEIS